MRLLLLCAQLSQGIWLQPPVVSLSPARVLFSIRIVDPAPA